MKFRIWDGAFRVSLRALNSALERTDVLIWGDCDLNDFG
ncbi:hypothetical protein PCO31110_01325 [Pandoraea communis]|uniref:Uncharacterized protein n=1 Tax=Pandoraea communis TaxID=2508297 RepID=A0A5E4TAZ7_9BURK|nr:hypothetical protein PCO31110_01325 [Pandoraea communis]